MKVSLPGNTISGHAIQHPVLVHPGDTISGHHRANFHPVAGKKGKTGSGSSGGSGRPAKPLPGRKPLDSSARFTWSPGDIEVKGSDGKVALAKAYERMEHGREEMVRAYQGRPGHGEAPGNASPLGGMQGDLTDSQRQLVQWYTGTGFETLNDGLRDPAQADEDTSYYAKAMDKLLAQVKPSAQPATVYRGMSGRLAGLKPGQTFTDKGFISTSTDQAVAQTFGHGSAPTVVKITLPKGTRALVPAQVGADLGDEKEAILPRGSSFRVTSAAKGVIEAELIPGGKDDKLRLADAQLNKRSGMISLDLPPGLIKAPGDGVKDSHVTVVYLGPDVDDDLFAQASDAAEAAAAASPPLHATFKGTDTFPEGKDGIPAIVPATVPGLDKVRAALEHLNASEHKGFRPHATLGYYQPGEDLPPAHPEVHAVLPGLAVHRGTDVRYFPFANPADPALAGLCRELLEDTLAAALVLRG